MQNANSVSLAPLRLTGGLLRHARARSQSLALWLACAGVLLGAQGGCRNGSDTAEAMLVAELRDVFAVDSGHTFPAKAIVLLYSPEDCFTCGNLLPEWLPESRRSDVPLHLMLTREPSSRERLQLA